MDSQRSPMILNTSRLSFGGPRRTRPSTPGHLLYQHKTVSLRSLLQPSTRPAAPDSPYSAFRPQARPPPPSSRLPPPPTRPDAAPPTAHPDQREGRAGEGRDDGQAQGPRQLAPGQLWPEHGQVESCLIFLTFLPHEVVCSFSNTSLLSFWLSRGILTHLPSPSHSFKFEPNGQGGYGMSFVR